MSSQGAASGADANDYCTVIFGGDKGAAPNQEEIMEELEAPEASKKVRALKKTILMMQQGEPMPKILMHVIRFCVNTNDHALKKVMMLYWEIVPKYDDERKLLPEMILVCNALRNDLNHPNEYVRGCMLRFLCKLKEPEILEPLIPSIKQNLEHRHSYVRRNAALAIFSIHRTYGDALLPDAAEVMDRFIQAEGDMSARRNAFLFLFNQCEQLALQFLATHIEDVVKYGDGFALLVLELTRKICRRDPGQKSRFVRVIYQMLNSNSAAVCYEAAWTLVSLSAAPTAVRAAAATYATLLHKQSDNNIKLIVLERLDELKKHHTKVLQEILMDILRALSSPNVDICKKTLEIAMDLVSPRNIEEVVQKLKSEVIRTQEADKEKKDGATKEGNEKAGSKGGAYRAMLIKSIHTCAVKFPDVAASVVHVLMDFLNAQGAMDVILFVRAIVDQYPALRRDILEKLLETLPGMKTANVYTVALWILGEYSGDADAGEAEREGEFQTGAEIDAERGGAIEDRAFAAICTLVGAPPFEEQEGSEEKEAEAKEDPAAAAAPVTKNVVLADGTYATQTVMSEEAKPVVEEEADIPTLRKLLMAGGGDFFLGSAVATCMTKIALRALRARGSEDNSVRSMQLDACQIMVGLARMHERKHPRDPATSGAPGTDSYPSQDCIERIVLCTRCLLDPAVGTAMEATLLDSCRSTFGEMLAARLVEEQERDDGNTAEPVIQPDQCVQFRQLRNQSGLGSNADIDIFDGADIDRATGLGADGAQSAFNHIYQLTGFADPVYAEANVTVHDYDIVLEIQVINRTPETLTNLTVELSTIGDLKLVERPQSHTIGPLHEATIRANIKVSSTETGHIFGTIVYDNAATAEKVYVNLNDIHMDIMDYIQPATCNPSEFRSMWAEFEWENKVAVNTSIEDVNEFLTHIVKNTNMRCMTPPTALGGASVFLAANLYARSIFGEDALVNLSVEKKDDGDRRLIGYIRIRSKTQGIALSLGDRITAVQRSASESEDDQP